MTITLVWIFATIQHRWFYALPVSIFKKPVLHIDAKLEICVLSKKNPSAYVYDTDSLHLTMACSTVVQSYDGAEQVVFMTSR